jgi:hypothetical protein
MEAVTKQERIVIERSPEDWLEHYLVLWASWMHSDELPDGCPEEASGGLQPFLDMDFDEMCARMDAEHAEIVNMVIFRLTPAERCAIHRQYLHAVYHVRNFEVVLLLAKAKVMHHLRNCGLWFGD